MIARDVAAASAGVSAFLESGYVGGGTDKVK